MRTEAETLFVRTAYAESSVQRQILSAVVALSQYETLARTGTGTLRRSDVHARAALEMDGQAAKALARANDAQEDQSLAMLRMAKGASRSPVEEQEAARAMAKANQAFSEHDEAVQLATHYRATAHGERGVENSITNEIVDGALQIVGKTNVPLKIANLFAAQRAVEAASALEKNATPVQQRELMALREEHAAAVNDLTAEYRKVDLLRASLAIVEQGYGRADPEEIGLRVTIANSIVAFQETGWHHLHMAHALRAAGPLSDVLVGLKVAAATTTDLITREMLALASVFTPERLDKIADDGLARLKERGLHFLPTAELEFARLGELGQSVEEFVHALHAAHGRDTELSLALGRFLNGERPEA